MLCILRVVTPHAADDDTARGSNRAPRRARTAPALRSRTVLRSAGSYRESEVLRRNLQPSGGGHLNSWTPYRERVTSGWRDQGDRKERYGHRENRTGSPPSRVALRADGSCARRGVLGRPPAAASCPQRTWLPSPLTTDSVVGCWQNPTTPLPPSVGVVRSRTCASPLRSAGPSRLALPPSPPPPVGDVLDSRPEGEAPQHDSRPPDQGRPRLWASARTLIATIHYVQGYCSWTPPQGGVNAARRS